MSKIIFGDTEGKRKILDVLLAFDNDKRKNIKFNQKKYQYANKIIFYQKSDLESARADIEHSVDSSRTLAAFLAIMGVILSKLISPSTENLQPLIEFGVTVLILVPSAFIFLEVAKRVAWLHIIKVAIALKSDLDFANNPTTHLTSF